MGENTLKKSLNSISSMEVASSLNTQIGGSHYKDYKIQPIEFIQVNSIPFIEGNAIKYICRHATKNGVQDIDKAIHYLELLKELQYES